MLETGSHRPASGHRSTQTRGTDEGDNTEHLVEPETSFPNNNLDLSKAIKDQANNTESKMVHKPTDTVLNLSNPSDIDGDEEW